MRDEIDGRFWTDHHEQFADTIDGLFAAIGTRLGRLAAWDGSTQHLLALVASFALTALSFNATTA